MTDDLTLLERFARRGDEDALRALIDRHLPLVYSVALRQVNGDAPLAEDVAQTVFTDLARKARILPRDVVLAGWLYEAARFAAAKAVRGERRRQAREQEALAMQHPASHSATENTPDWEQLSPVLDDAMGELTAPDREAILLRYFQNQDLHAVGRALGVSEDAAQKRVSRAVERLRESLAQRGVTTGAQGLVVVIAAHAVLVAPAGLSAAIATAALAGTTLITAATTTVGKAIAMTTTQKVLITAFLAAAVGTGIYEARDASNLRSQVQTLQQRPSLTEQVQQLTAERDEAIRHVAALLADKERPARDTAELLKLRGEVTLLRNSAPAPTRLPPAIISTEAASKSWLKRVEQLKQHVEQNPKERIPEFQFLTDREWLLVADAGLETESFQSADDYDRAMQALRTQAEVRFFFPVQVALRKFSRANNGQFPNDFPQLQPYCEPPVMDTLRELYEIQPATILPENVRHDIQAKFDWVITRKKRPNSNSTSRLAMFADGYAYWQSPP